MSDVSLSLTETYQSPIDMRNRVTHTNQPVLRRLRSIHSVVRKNQHKAGFAIIVTVSILVLLAVVAVGLLTLSTVTVRAAQRGDATSIARANARLALTLAIGELQKHAGPDQSITARANIVGANVPNPQVTGVWSSWEIKATEPPSPAEFETDARHQKFRSWLVSSTDPTAAANVDYIRDEPQQPKTLWGEGTLGSNPDSSKVVRATKVPVADSGSSRARSTFAYAVLDEGTKARVNTGYKNDTTSKGAQTASLGSGQRPGTEFMPGLKELKRDYFQLDSSEFATIEKGITPSNNRMVSDQLAPGTDATLRTLTHDVTTHSVGLFTDVARGGLKEDFNLLTNTNALPPLLRNKGVYVSNLGLNESDAPSDPRWETLREFCNVHRDHLEISAGSALVKHKIPKRWRALTESGRTTTVNTEPPEGLTLLPTIAKVQVLFSLIGRDLYTYPRGRTPRPDSPQMHGPQGNHFRGTKYEYDLHLMYTPIITVHNPYNVALRFDNLRVEFVRTPFSMQVFRNGAPQSTGLVPVDTMYADNESGSKEKTFGVNLYSERRGRPSRPSFTLLPGEVKVFSPYVDPNRTYADEFRGGRENWDIFVGSDRTADITAIPGWRGDGLGFSCDWLASNKRIDGNKENGRWASCFGLAKNDRIHVLFAPLGVDRYSDNKFIIQLKGTRGSRQVTSAIEIDYEQPDGLQRTLLGANGTLRYPSDGTVRGIDLVDHSTTPLSEIANVKPFALLSVQAKTTHGHADPAKEDGRYATKPWSFAHAVTGVSQTKILSQHPSNASHEFDLQLLDNGTSNLVQVDAQNRGNFITGHSAFNGSKFGVQYEIPFSPIQTLPGLNSANPGGASGQLPRFAHPIGNSWAHPLLSPSSFIEPGPSGNYLDHSFLLNLAMYDRYYFSGIADQTGPYGSGKTAATLANEFSSGLPLQDPRMILNTPKGLSDANLADEITADDAYTKVAAWQVMEGAFNVNSTSVAAWKAMLASVHDLESLVNEIDKSGGTAAITDLPDVDANEVRISRLRLPASKSAADGADPKDGFWLGPRELSDDELQTLAENIVKQVRLRGPFLSMADFVNRRLGDENDEMAQRGALQQAIDDSDLNEHLAQTALAGFNIPADKVSSYNYKNPTAGTGASYQGAPGYLTQADLLNVLGNAASARSDTFTIRGYGEATDGNGNTLAEATCEAVVQRIPEWIDERELVETPVAALEKPANRNFGRRFIVTSFRWLGPTEL